METMTMNNYRTPVLEGQKTIPANGRFVNDDPLVAVPLSLCEAVMAYMAESHPPDGTPLRSGINIIGRVQACVTTAQRMAAAERNASEAGGNGSDDGSSGGGDQ